MTTHEKKFPVVEVFGPTIQGEGPDQGMPCYFVRFGGCDYRCEWCDTPYAVLPASVRQAHKMTAAEIVQAIERLAPGPSMVVLSGGNPALHDLAHLVSMLNHVGEYRVSVETQGTLWKEWINSCDRVIVSPKPPSSGEIGFNNQVRNFMQHLQSCENYTALKIVVFDQRDYEYARMMHRVYPQFKMYLSAGNDAGSTVGNPGRVDERSTEQVARDLIEGGRVLVNRTMVDQDMHDVQVQVQNHVLYWGNERGK